VSRQKNISKWDEIVNQFLEKQSVKLREAGYSGQGHTSGAESFYGGYFGYGGDKQLAAKPIAIVRKIKKQEDEELGMNFKDNQERNRDYPDAAGSRPKKNAGEFGGAPGGGSARIPNNIPQIGKTIGELDAEYELDPTKNYWGSIPDEEENIVDEPYDGSEDIKEQAGGAGGGPVRGGASDSAYRDLPGFPRMNALDDKRVFVPPVEGDYDGDGEEDEYLDYEEYVNDTLRLNGLSVKPEKLQQLFYPDGIREETLYHGTSLDNLGSIKELGLSGELGDFVQDSYGMDMDDDELEGITFAADKNSISSAAGAIRYHVGKKLDKWLSDVTEEDIKKYGMLVVIKDIEKPKDDKYFDYKENDDGGWHQRPNNQSDEGYYSSYPPSVEPGDWFVQDGSGYDIILTGKKMMKVLRALGGLDDLKSNDRRELIKYAVASYGSKRTTKEIVDKVKSLTDAEVKYYLKTYTNDETAIKNLKKHREERYAGKNQKHKGDQLKFDFSEGKYKLGDVFFENKKCTLLGVFKEGGDYGSPGGSLGSGGTEQYKQGDWNQEPDAELLINPVDYSGGHADIPAADQTPAAGLGFGNIITPKDFVPEDWEQRNWKTQELPVEAENLEKLELGEGMDEEEENSIVERASVMSAKKLVKKLNKNKKPGCNHTRQKGSHAFYKCGACSTVIPMHGSKDVKTGTLRAIEKDLEGCLGDDWLEEAIERFVKEVFEEAYTGIDDETGNGSPEGGSDAFDKSRKSVLDYDEDQKPNGKKDDLKNYHFGEEKENNDD